MSQTIFPLEDITPPLIFTHPFAPAVYDKSSPDDLTYAMGLFELSDVETWEISLSPPDFLPNGSFVDLTMRFKASTTSSADVLTAELFAGGVSIGSVDIGATLSNAYQDFTIHATGVTDFNNLTVVFTLETFSASRTFYCSYVAATVSDPLPDDYYSTAQSLTTMGCGASFNVAT